MNSFPESEIFFPTRRLNSHLSRMALSYLWLLLHYIKCTHVRYRHHYTTRAYYFIFFWILVCLRMAVRIISYISCTVSSQSVMVHENCVLEIWNFYYVQHVVKGLAFNPQRSQCPTLSFDHNLHLIVGHNPQLSLFVTISNLVINSNVEFGHNLQLGKWSQCPIWP